MGGRWFCPFLTVFNLTLNFRFFLLLTLFSYLAWPSSSVGLSLLLDMNNINNNTINDLSFACINCNSLNMSDCRKGLQKNKIYGIAKLRTDIIFLSDVRMSSRNRISSFNDIATVFRINPYCSYKLLYNSSMNKRGVGILIKNDLLFLESAREADDEENFLLVKSEIKGRTLIIGSVYGPNTQCPNFFVKLSTAIRNMGNFPVILGGDWNCTISTDPTVNNPDCLNMANPPNIRHSILLGNVCDEFDLVDPFRSLYPNRKDFTFCPRSINQNNRSRIDFFTVSRELLAGAQSCSIAPGLQSRLFDHKAVILDFYPVKSKKNGRTYISNATAKLPDCKIV
jgi:exonuclease III